MVVRSVLLMLGCLVSVASLAKSQEAIFFEWDTQKAARPSTLR